MRAEQFDPLIRELRAIRGLLEKVANPVVLWPEKRPTRPKPESLAETYRLLSQPSVNHPVFTLHQPHSPHHNERREVASLRELEAHLNRQKLSVDSFVTDGWGYAVYESSALCGRPEGKWLIGYLDRPFAPAAVTH